MIRDTLKDQEYFEKYISRERARIEKFSKIIEDLIGKKGIEDEGVKDSHLVLSLFKTNLLYAMYSAGYDIKDIVTVYEQLMPEYKELNKFTYVDTLLIASLTILFDDKGQYGECFSKMITNSDMEDALLETLNRYIKNKEIIISDKDFKFEEKYGILKKVFTEENKDKKVEYLKEYLDTWYSKNSDAAWYDSHKSKLDTYHGYWCIESAAIVKMLDLDDALLKKSKYYPADMLNR